MWIWSLQRKISLKWISKIIQKIVPLKIFRIIFQNWISIILFKLDFTLKSNFVFKVKQKTRCREFPLNPSSSTCIASPAVNIPHSTGIFVITDGPTLTYHHHAKWRVYMVLPSWCCVFYDFYQVYKDIVKSHRVSALPVYPSSTSTPGKNTDYFIVL